MKTLIKITLLSTFAVSLLLIDVPFLQLVSEAEAVAGVRRRTARRTAVVVGSTSAAAASAATASANQQAAAAQQQTAAANQQAADAEAQAQAAEQQAAAAQAEADAYKQQAQAAGPLPIGTVVTALPPGCTNTTSGGVEYSVCGQNYYRTAFQGSQLVYVTTEKP